MKELEQLCEEALYEEIRPMEDGKSIVRDIPTGKLFYKKTLEVFNPQVFAYLKEHQSRYVPRIQAFWKEGDKLVVIEELVQGQTLEEMLMSEIREADLQATRDPASDLSAANATSSGSSAANATTSGLSAANATASGLSAANATASSPSAAGTRRKGLSFQERIDILTQICDGLTFLHSAEPPIIHRDIKASNIMVTDDHIVKIIDYDAAKIYVTGQKKDTVMIGTQGLAAPEQYGFAQSDVRTDLYALGKLIARLLPGNADAQRITAKATEMDPKKRYSSAEQMKAQILRIREHIATLDDQLEKIPGYDPMNPSHRFWSRFAIFAGGAAVCILTMLLGWFIFVYPSQVNNRLEADMAAITKMENDQDQITEAVTNLTENYNYSHLSGKQKKKFREGMAEIMKRCYGVNSKGELAEKTRDALTETYGESETWEAVMQYGQAEYKLDHAAIDSALWILYSQRKAEAPDAQEYWEAGFARVLKSTRSLRDNYEQLKNVNQLRGALNEYLILIKYDGETAKEAEELYNESLSEAKRMRENKNYDGAVAILRVLEEVLYIGNSDDAQDDEQDAAGTTSVSGIKILSKEEFTNEIQETYYQKAGSEFDNKKYSDAIRSYRNLGDYKDSKERYNESIYQCALSYRDGENYSEAIKQLSTIPGYKDADTLVSDIKFILCQNKINDPDETIYEYIEELVRSGYEGAEELRDEMYDWHVKIKTVMAYSIGTIQGASIQAELSGGPPDGSVVITFTVYDPSHNDTMTWSDEKSYHKGETATTEVSEDYTDFDMSEHPFKVTVYAKGDGIDGVLGTWEGYFGQDEEE